MKKSLQKVVILFALLSSISTTSALANEEPQLIEVNAKNKPNCVEYFMQNNKFLCSTTAILPKFDPKTIDYETANLIFDNRIWVPAWGKKDPSGLMVEYIPKGDNINDWQEMVTSQFYPMLHLKLTPKALSEEMIQRLRSKIPSTKTNYISTSPTNVLWEYRVAEPKEMAEHEIQRIFQTKNGLHVVHYVTKDPNMDSRLRTEWIKRLQAVTPKSVDISNLDKVKKHLLTGDRFLQKRNFSEAQNNYQQALKIYTDNNLSEKGLLGYLHSVLAKIAIEVKDLDAAESHLKTVINLQGNTYESAEPTYGLSTVYFFKGDMVKAEEYAKQSLELLKKKPGAINSPTAIGKYETLSTIYLKQMRLDEAKPMLKTARDLAVQHLGPQNPKTLELKKTYEHIERLQ